MAWFGAIFKFFNMIFKHVRVLVPCSVQSQFVANPSQCADAVPGYAKISEDAQEPFFDIPAVFWLQCCFLVVPFNRHVPLPLIQRILAWPYQRSSSDVSRWPSCTLYPLSRACCNKPKKSFGFALPWVLCTRPMSTNAFATKSFTSTVG